MYGISRNYKRFFTYLLVVKMILKSLHGTTNVSQLYIETNKSNLRANEKTPSRDHQKRFSIYAL
jgi:hypothetical protein